MIKISTRLLLFTFFLTASLGYCQTITSVVIDSATQKPIPLVNVKLNQKGAITNEEGRFTLHYDKTIQPTDSLFLSCIGYASLGKPLSEFTEAQIILAPKAIDLNPVIVTNKNYSPEEIIEKVEENITKNYTTSPSKQRIFLRETFTNRVLKKDYILKKSTIQEFDKAFIDNLLTQIPSYSTIYNEVLGDLYSSANAESHKLNLIKASELYDKSQELDFEVLEERFNEIIKKNVKTDSYFKIKSGLFGTKIQNGELFETEIDSTDIIAVNKELEEKKKSTENRKKNYAKYKRITMENLYAKLPIFEDTDYNVIFKPNRYNLSLDDFTYLGDDAIYVISFYPKRSEDYSGKLYINADDFALIRMDFENVKSLKNFKLLGISVNDYLAKGSVIFNKGDKGKYNLRYFDIQKGSRVGLKRPLKIIELNKVVKGKNKQNELSMKIDAAFGNRSRHELVVFNETPITSNAFEGFTEQNTVLPTYMANYDPEFWKGYNIIEPNQAIKEFTSITTALD